MDLPFTTTTTPTTPVAAAILKYCKVQYLGFKESYFSSEWWFLQVTYTMKFLLSGPDSQVITAIPPHIFGWS